MDLARALTMPSLAMSLTLALAIFSGNGDRRLSSGNGVLIFSPKASVKRQDKVVAALTVIC